MTGYATRADLLTLQRIALSRGACTLEQSNALLRCAWTVARVLGAEDEIAEVTFEPAPRVFAMPAPDLSVDRCLHENARRRPDSALLWCPDCRQDIVPPGY